LSFVPPELLTIASLGRDATYKNISNATAHTKTADSPALAGELIHQKHLSRRNTMRDRAA
jgi:hypothetical protein